VRKYPNFRTRERDALLNRQVARERAYEELDTVCREIGRALDDGEALVPQTMLATKLAMALRKLDDARGHRKEPGTQATA
jgi:hypothetical protein